MLVDVNEQVWHGKTFDHKRTLIAELSTKVTALASAYVDETWVVFVGFQDGSIRVRLLPHHHPTLVTTTLQLFNSLRPPSGMGGVEQRCLARSPHAWFPPHTHLHTVCATA